MCRDILECKNYYEWDETLHISDHSRDYESDNTWVSCRLSEAEHNITEYPEDCPHKIALDLFKKERKAAMIEFHDRLEKEAIWDKLNAVE